MTIYVWAILAFLLGTALGGAVCFLSTSDSYEQDLDALYGENLELRRQVSEYEDLIENMRPKHCAPSTKVSKIVEIDWQELDFPNSEVNHD